MNIVCVISARGGSTGLPNKNIKKLCGKPLIHWTIKQAKSTKLINNVFVSTDSKMIKLAAINAGAEVPFLRSKKLSGKFTSKFLVWRDALLRLELILKKKIDIFIDLDCTNPLRSKKDIENALKYFLKNKNKCDAVISIAKSKKNPYFNMLEKNKNGFFKISKKISKWPSARQIAPKVYDQVASIYCLNREFILKKNNLYQGKLLGYTMEYFKSVDIDNQEDFNFVEYLFKKYSFHKKN